MTQEDARVILNDLADRGILLDYEITGVTFYSLPPPMAGFFEFFLIWERNYLTNTVLILVNSLMPNWDNSLPYPL